MRSRSAGAGWRTEGTAQENHHFAGSGAWHLACLPPGDTNFTWEARRGEKEAEFLEGASVKLTQCIRASFQPIFRIHEKTKVRNTVLASVTWHPTID